MTNKEKTTTEVAIYAIVIISLSLFFGYYAGRTQAPKIVTHEKVIEVAGECREDQWKELKRLDDEMYMVNLEIMGLFIETSQAVSTIQNPVVEQNIVDYDILVTEHYRLLEMERQLLIVELY